MAITYPLVLPASAVGAGTFTMMGETVSSISQSPFTFAQQIFKHPGERWKASVQLAPMKRQDSEAWVSFLLSLKGKSGTFLMGDPNGAQPQGSVVQRNLLQYSEDYSNAYWTKTNATVVSVGTSNPVSGLPTGVWNLVEASDVAQQHYINKIFPFIINNTYTVSAYGKLGSGRNIRIALTSTSFGVAQDCRFNLTTGVATSLSGTATLTMTLLPNGFYRCTVTATATVSASSNIYVYLDNGTTTVYNGDGVSYAIVSDAQVEVSTSASSYQKTLGAWGPTPLVNGASQTGSSLIINNLNWSNTGVFSAGDYIQLGSSSTSTLHKVLTTTTSDAAGNATIDIFPAIRTAPASGATIAITNTVGRWRIATDITQWEINNISSYGINFDCVEAI